MAHRISPEAEADLAEIWLYLARRSGSMDIADRVIDALTERCYLISTNPFIGRSRDNDLRPGVRSSPMGEYVIFYRVEDEDVLVLNILHGSRDIEALFRS